MTIELLIALTALALSLLSYLTARKALKITEKEHQDKNLGITPYLVDAFKWVAPDTKKLIFFAVTYTNKSSSPNTLSKTDLIIEYYSDNNEIHTAKIDPAFFEYDEMPINSAEVISLPVNLNPKSTISGWLSFHLNSFLGEKLIKSYKLVSTTSDNKDVTLTHNILREITNENAR